MAPIGKLARRLATTLLPLVLVGFFASCAAYEFDRQHVVLRHAQEDDTLELLVVSQGLRAPRDSSESVASATRQANADSEGYLHVILLGWPWEFDVPEIQEGLREGLAAPVDPDADPDEAPDPAQIELAERSLELLARVEVIEASPILHRGRLGLVQRLRIGAASEWVALANDAISYGIRRAGSSGAFAEWMLTWADAETVDEWLRWAANREPWILLEEGELRLRAPLSEKASASALRGLLDWSQGSDGAVAQLFEPLGSLRVADGMIELVYAPGEDGTIPFRFDFDHEDGKRLEPGKGPFPEPPADVARLLAQD